FATALRSNFSIGSAAKTPANCSSTSASFTLRPRIASATRRNLRGPTRANFRCATASITSPQPYRRRDRGTRAWAQTRRACVRPCSRSRKRERALYRCARRWCARPLPARSWTRGSRFSRRAFRGARSCLRSWRSNARLRTGPSSSCGPLFRSSLANDHVARAFVAPRLLAHRHLPPRRGRRASGRRTRLAAAVRMVDGVHRNAAHARTLAAMALASGFADDLVLVLDVAELSDRGAADDQDLAHFARRHTHLRVLAFFGHQLSRTAGAAHEFAALAGTQFDVVDDRTDRNVLDRKTVAGLNVGRRTRLDDVADLQAQGRQDVPLLAVAIMQQRDARRTVRIVFERSDLGRNGIFAALEVDDAIHLARSAALMAYGDVTVEVAAGMFLAYLDQRLLRLDLAQVREVHRGHEAFAGAGRLVFLDGH